MDKARQNIRKTSRTFYSDKIKIICYNISCFYLGQKQFLIIYAERYKLFSPGGKAFPSVKVARKYRDKKFSPSGRVARKYRDKKLSPSGRVAREYRDKKLSPSGRVARERRERSSRGRIIIKYLPVRQRRFPFRGECLTSAGIKSFPLRGEWRASTGIKSFPLRGEWRVSAGIKSFPLRGEWRVSAERGHHLVFEA